ncbi:MAG: phosphoribosyl-ATP diphosphatase [Pseudomonadota bacterium]|nr:phosphoribosyl-ATP diphosphatase [Pseudomonadota bacterium]
MADTADILERLHALAESRKTADPSTSYMAKLHHRGTKKIAQKVGEEAVETAIAAVAEGRDAVIAESADLLFHLVMLWSDAGIAPHEVMQALAAREGSSGLAEKAARRKD